MPSNWTEHVRKYAKDNNISYMCAISEASKTYNKKKPIKKKTEPVKNNILELGSYNKQMKQMKKKRESVIQSEENHQKRIQEKKADAEYREQKNKEWEHKKNMLEYKVNEAKKEYNGYLFSMSIYKNVNSRRVPKKLMERIPYYVKRYNDAVKEAKKYTKKEYPKLMTIEEFNKKPTAKENIEREKKEQEIIKKEQERIKNMTPQELEEYNRPLTTKRKKKRSSLN